MPDPYRYSISLKLTHPHLDPEAISAVLGLQPSTAWKAGGPKINRHGRQWGNPAKETYWTTRLVDAAKDEPQSLPEALGDQVLALRNHADFLRHLRAEGGSAELFVGWWFPFNGDKVFPVDLLRSLADLGLDLRIDAYVETSDESEEP